MIIQAAPLSTGCLQIICKNVSYTSRIDSTANTSPPSVELNFCGFIFQLRWANNETGREDEISTSDHQSEFFFCCCFLLHQRINWKKNASTKQNMDNLLLRVYKKYKLYCIVRDSKIRNWQSFLNLCSGSLVYDGKSSLRPLVDSTVDGNPTEPKGEIDYL